MTTKKEITFMALLLLGSLANAVGQTTVTFDFKNNYKEYFGFTEDVTETTPFTEDKTVIVDGVSVTLPAQGYSYTTLLGTDESYATGLRVQWGNLYFIVASAPDGEDQKPVTISVPEDKRILSVTAGGSYYVTYDVEGGTFNGSTWTDLYAKANTVHFTVNINDHTTTKGGNVTLNTLTVTYVDEDYFYVPAPSFKKAGGNINEAFTAEINVPDGTTVYYTTDGTNPEDNASATPYDAETGIDISATTTINAQATDGQGHWSSVVSVTYTFPTATTTLAQLKALPEGTYATYNNPNGFVVTGIGNGYATISDESADYMFQYALLGNLNTLVRGQKVKGMLRGTVALKEGFTQEPYARLEGAEKVGDFEIDEELVEIAAQEVTSNQLANYAGKTVTVNFKGGDANVKLPYVISWSTSIRGFGTANMTVADIPATGDKVSATGVVVEYGDHSYYLWPVERLISYIVDENDEQVVTTAHNDVRVRLNRTLQTGAWNTFVVPFDFSAKAVAEVFGEETRVAALESSDGETMTFTTTDAGITANTPCLVKPTKEVAAPVEIANVNLKQTATAEAGDDNAKLIGTYSAISLANDGHTWFLGADDALYQPDGTGIMKPLRAYFKTAEGSNARLALSIDGVTTGISQIENRQSKIDNSFDLQGRRVDSDYRGLVVVKTKDGMKKVMRQ